MCLNEEYLDSNETELQEAEDSRVENEQEQEQSRLRDPSTLKQPDRFQADFAQCNDPMVFQDAINCKEVQHWIKAINEELQAHEINKTWEILPRKENQKVIDSKWM